MKTLNIADYFSMYRIVTAPILLVLALFGEREVFTWMLLISYMTDGIDGFLARTFKLSSARGSQLDSYGDQMTFAVALVGLWIFENTFIRENLVLILIAFVPYLIQMLLAFRKYGKASSFHTYLAKLSAIVQAVFILWLLFFGPVYPLFYVMIVLGVIETLEEITLIYMYDNWVEGVKGVFWALRDKRRIKSS